MTDDTGPMGPVTYGVLLEFGFGYSEKHKRWRARFDLGCRNTKKHTHPATIATPHLADDFVSSANFWMLLCAIPWSDLSLSLMRKHI